MKVRTRKALITNKKPKRKGSGLRVDPTRTSTLRKRFCMSLRKKFSALKVDILKLVIDEDAFGLARDKRAVRNELTTNAPDWRFNSDHEKVKLFQAWLRTQVAKRLSGLSEEKLWDAYIRQAYEKGQGRAFDDTTKSERFRARGEEKLDFYNGSRQQFLRDSFRQPASQEKVKLLAGRSFDDLDGVTSEMSTRITRSLVDGMIQGSNPRDIAREMAEDVDLGQGRAELIARTEIIRAHAEGQLDSLERMGVAEVGVEVEWSTAGDLRVCEDCADMEGMVLSIEDARGMIPRHPNCRCSWIPAGVGEPTENRRYFITNRRHMHVNSFCPTGEGGGVDPTCSPSQSTSQDRAEKSAAYSNKLHGRTWHYLERPQSEKFNTPELKKVEDAIEEVASESFGGVTKSFMDHPDDPQGIIVVHFDKIDTSLDSDQIDTKRGINKALEEAGEDDNWGPDVAISRDRPEGIFNTDEHLPLLNWCNQYGGDTCKDGSGFTPKDKGKAYREEKSARLDKALDHIKKLREKKRITPKDVKELTDHLSKLTVSQVQAIKKGMNVKASGKKKELVEKVAKGVKEQLLKDRPKLEKQPPPKQPEAPKVEKDPIGKLPKDATTDQRLKAFQEHMDANHPRNLTPTDEKRLEEVKEKLFGGKRLRGREKMQKEYNELVNRKYNNQINADSERTRQAAREALVRAFKVGEPADVRFGAGVAPGRDGVPHEPSTPSEKAALDTAHSFVRSLTAQNGQDDPIVVQYYRETGNDRAHQTGGWYINVGNAAENPSTIVHELGHIIEEQKPGVQDAAKEFLAKRISKDEKPQEISYLKKEYGFEDKFKDAFGSSARYVGKVYLKDRETNINYVTPSSIPKVCGPTEVISMGIQKLYDNPYHFARTDPEYMKFVLGTLRDRTYRGRNDTIGLS